MKSITKFVPLSLLQQAVLLTVLMICLAGWPTDLIRLLIRVRVFIDCVLDFCDC